MSYVVIEIDMNYDFIENVKIKKIFNSKEECEEYIKSREKEFYKSFELKNKYIDNFVKTIKLPDLNGNSCKICYWKLCLCALKKVLMYTAHPILKKN